MNGFFFPTIQQLPPTHHLFKSCLCRQIWTVLSKCPNRENITICRIGDHAVFVENTHDFLQKQSFVMWAPSKRSSCCHRSQCTGCNQRTKSLQLYDHVYCTKWSNEKQQVQHTDASLLHVVHVWNSQDFTLNKRDLVTYLLWKITIFHLCIDEHSGCSVQWFWVPLPLSQPSRDMGVRYEVQSKQVNQLWSVFCWLPFAESLEF
jgi:hypothetical protein